MEYFLALIDDLVVVLELQFAQREIATTGNFDIFARLSLCELDVASDYVDRCKVL